MGEREARGRIKVREGGKRGCVRTFGPTRPARTRAWKMSMTHATVSAMKPKYIAQMPAIWRRSHRRKGTGCLRSAHTRAREVSKGGIERWVSRV